MNVTTRNLFGAFYFLAVAVMAFWRWEETGKLFYSLFVFRMFLFAAFMMLRPPATIQCPRWQRFVAYLTMLVPLLYSANEPVAAWQVVAADSLHILGYLLALLAAIELGTSFGVSPAVRPRVQSGVYRYLHHPMYVGYGMAEFGWIILSIANLPVFVLSMGMQSLRAFMETKIIRTKHISTPNEMMT